MNRRKQPNIKLVRNLIAGGVALIVLAVVVTGVLYVSGITDGDDFVEGQHYRILDIPPDNDGPIEVREFFSWACIHCYNFEAHVEQWLQTRPADVEFTRTPASFSPAWALLARAYYAMDSLGILEQNRRRMFVAIHDQRRPLTTPRAIGEFLLGTDADTFEQAFRAPRVQRAWQQGEQLARRVGLDGVPALVVANRYYIPVGEVGSGVAFRVVDHLVEMERKRRAAL